MKICVSRRIYKVEQILILLMGIAHRYGLCLNSNSSLSFYFEFVKKLCLRMSRNGIGYFEKAVGKGTFTVVDVCDDAEVADEVRGHLTESKGNF